MAELSSTGGVERGVRSDQVSGIFLLLVALYVAWESRVYPLGTLEDPGPGYMPLLLAVFLGIMGLLIAVFGGKTSVLAAIPWPEAQRAVLILIMCGAGTFALERIGYRVTMIALLLFFLGVVERRNPVAAALVAIGFSVGSYYLFSTLLQVQLPRSPWGF